MTTEKKLSEEMLSKISSECAIECADKMFADMDMIGKENEMDSHQYIRFLSSTIAFSHFKMLQYFEHMLAQSSVNIPLSELIDINQRNILQNLEILNSATQKQQ